MFHSNHGSTRRCSHRLRYALDSNTVTAGAPSITAVGVPVSFATSSSALYVGDQCIKTEGSAISFAATTVNLPQNDMPTEKASPVMQICHGARAEPANSTTGANDAGDEATENIDAAELEPAVEAENTSVKEDVPAELQPENAGTSAKPAAPDNVPVAPLAGVGTQLPAALGLHESNNSFNSNNTSHSNNTSNSNNPSNSTGFYNYVPKTMRVCTAMIQQSSRPATVFGPRKVLSVPRCRDCQTQEGPQ
jgi:hypothetical protein